MLRRGVFDALPFAPSVLALGAIFGASTGAVGLPPLGAVLMSVLVFSGYALAYTVTDESYALAVTRQRRSPSGVTTEPAALDPAYLVGTWLVLYGVWVIGTIVGVLLGAQVPSEWIGPLEQVFPLVFLVLTVLLCTSRQLALVAVLGAVLSVAGALVLPNGWNVIVAGLLASLCGPFFARFK